MSEKGDKARDEEFRDVLGKAKEGDRAAWEEIFQRLGNEKGEEGAAVLAIARKALPRSHWARELVESRDILQSALRVGWLNADQFRGETAGELFSWIRTILRNKIERAGRRKENRSRDLAGGLQDVPEGAGRPEGEAPIDSAIEAEVRARVRGAIQQLPEDQRQVMELYLQGLSAPEIARLLDLTPVAVRKRESRATARLREILSE